MANKRLIASRLSVRPAKINALDISDEYTSMSDALAFTDPVSAHGYALWAKRYSDMGDVEIDWFEIRRHRTYEDGSGETVAGDSYSTNRRV